MGSHLDDPVYHSPHENVVVYKSWPCDPFRLKDGPSCRGCETLTYHVLPLALWGPSDYTKWMVWTSTPSLCNRHTDQGPLSFIQRRVSKGGSRQNIVTEDFLMVGQHYLWKVLCFFYCHLIHWWYFVNAVHMYFSIYHLYFIFISISCNWRFHFTSRGSGTCVSEPERHIVEGVTPTLPSIVKKFETLDMW